MTAPLEPEELYRSVSIEDDEDGAVFHITAEGVGHLRVILNGHTVLFDDFLTD